MNSRPICVILNALYITALLSIRGALVYEATVNVLLPMGLFSVTMAAWMLLAVSLFIRLVRLANPTHSRLTDIAGEVLIFFLNIGIAWAVGAGSGFKLTMASLVGAQIAEWVLLTVRPSFLAAAEQALRKKRPLPKSPIL